MRAYCGHAAITCGTSSSDRHRLRLRDAEPDRRVRRRRDQPASPHRHLGRRAHGHRFRLHRSTHPVSDLHGTPQAGTPTTRVRGIRHLRTNESIPGPPPAVRSARHHPGAPPPYSVGAAAAHPARSPGQIRAVPLVRSLRHRTAGQSHRRPRSHTRDHRRPRSQALAQRAQELVLPQSPLTPSGPPRPWAARLSRPVEN